jgi:primosomal protein N' (replication factor Y)
VQTIAPEARAIRHAAEHDSAGFVADELKRREALRYPPFAHLIRVVFAAESSEPARSAAGAVRELLATALGPGSQAAAPTSVLGPAALFRLRGRERQVLVIKAAERRAAVAAVGEAVARVAGDRRHGEVAFSVDVDPQ